jgi:hypothetical protein
MVFHFYIKTEVVNTICLIALIIHNIYIFKTIIAEEICRQREKRLNRRHK